MSGHSKWSNTKHRKAIQDAKREKLFNKLIRELIIAVKIGGSSDPDNNPRLRTAINKALLNNMEKNRIKRAIDRGLNVKI
ncbi:Probable transcriptional regulatory protein YebC [Candidatus Johnevansia muelleri]|uniref:Probable transcriptional regulatory protein YebC n=1 Tax=Candidatus Johnevansia muelleri TaxID=1495769 RepID=A0A078KI56_9GAMM|nr:Probable transcriptional regulatory protein YebC [Candidatus Evansia muelleri]